MHVSYQVFSIVGGDAWSRKAFGPEADWSNLVLVSMCVYDRKWRDDDEYAFVVFLFEFCGVDGVKFRPCGVFDKQGDGIMMCMMLWKALHWLFIINIMRFGAIIDRTRSKEIYCGIGMFIHSELFKLSNKKCQKQARKHPHQSSIFTNC